MPSYSSRTNALKALKEFSPEAVHHAKDLLLEKDGRFYFNEDAAEKYLQDQEVITSNLANQLEITMNVKLATLAQLVAFYNEHTETPIKKFRDRATAERRCQEVFNRLNPVTTAPLAEIVAQSEHCESCERQLPLNENDLCAECQAASDAAKPKKGKKSKKSEVARQLQEALAPVVQVVPVVKTKPLPPKATPARVLRADAEAILKQSGCPYCGDTSNGCTYDDEPGKETDFRFCHVCSTSFNSITGKLRYGHADRSASDTQADTMKTSMKLIRIIEVLDDEGKHADVWKNAFQMWKAHSDWMTSAQQDGLTAKLYASAKLGIQLTVTVNGRSFRLVSV